MSEKKCIGIDVGGTSVKIGLFETDGTLLFKWEVPTRKEEGGRYILEDVAASIREVLTEKEIHDLAFKCSFEDTRTIGVFKQLNMKDMEKIYLAAR